MHKPRAIWFLVFLSAAANSIPHSAHASADATNSGKSAPKAPSSNLPKMSFDGQPQNEAAPKAAEPAKASEPAKESPPKTPAPVEKTAAVENAEDKPKQPSPLSIPFVEGYDSLGLKIPDFDPASGTLKSWYSIGTLRRLDDKTVELRESYLELYKADGSREVSVDLPKASLDRFTRKVESKVPVLIWNDEFHITGATMELDTVSKEASLGGPVRVLIYKLSGNSSEGSDSGDPTEQPDDTSRAEPQAGEAPKMNGAPGVKKDKIN